MVLNLKLMVNRNFKASLDCRCLLQELLYLLYTRGDLSKYPMAIGNLGDLEEIAPIPGHPTPVQLFQEAIDVARRSVANI